MKITSTSFDYGEPIPDVYSYDGDNLNPPLDIGDIPREARSMALIVEDPDAPAQIFTHWIVYNISPSTTEVTAGAVPTGAEQGMNDFGQQTYGGPRPPSGMHRYFFKVFALDEPLPARSNLGRAQLYTMMEGHVLDSAELVGVFGSDD